MTAKVKTMKNELEALREHEAKLIRDAIYYEDNGFPLTARAVRENIQAVRVKIVHVMEETIV